MTIATGQKMYADDLLNLLFFPRGAILMYDGTSWQDNVTLKGWYQCSKNPDGTAKIVDGYTVPDLQDKFIMGHSGGSRTGGNNSLELTANNLPSHGHNLSNMSMSGLTVTEGGGIHSHTVSGSVSQSGGHAHTVSGQADAITRDSTGTRLKDLTGTFSGPYRLVASNIYTGIVTDTGTSGGDADGWEHRQPLHKINIDATHTHTVTGSTAENSGTHDHAVAVSITGEGTHTHSISGGTISGSVGNTGSSTAFDNRPSYYTLIYIVKVTAAGS
jgi:microcystin-dependent protein